MVVAKVAMTIAAPPPQRKPKTVEDRLREHGAKVDERLRPLFAARKISYPPAKLTLLGLKDEKKLEVYAADQSNVWRMIKSYDVLAASGTMGPKMREGDRQVPEGIYKISLLNPNSLYHLSLRVNYPNEFDRRMASEDGRTRLGGDIMIHGNAVSIGCVAIGDEGAEDLFVLAARTGLPNISVILSPLDFRKRRLPVNTPGSPKWIEELYSSIQHELNHYPPDMRLD
ncbi:MAG: L,D-transpeptidase family protein [Pyrinomonadaceae bacterium]